MFGKRIPEYLRFQKAFLGLLVAVGLVRLVLSLAGLPDTTVRWLSMNVVLWVAALYHGVTVHTRGFAGLSSTPIAFGRSDQGPANMLVDGALCYRASSWMTPAAE